MREAKVTIEERLVRTITLTVPDDVKDEDVMEWAENEARTQYHDEELVLTAEDLAEALMEVEDSMGRYSDWMEV